MSLVRVMMPGNRSDSLGYMELEGSSLVVKSPASTSLFCGTVLPTHWWELDHPPESLTAPRLKWIITTAS